MAWGVRPGVQWRSVGEKQEESVMDREVFEDAGKLLLRLAVGGLMLFHGVLKLRPGHGLASIKALVIAKALPGFIGYGVYLGEIIAPLLLIAGVATRAAAATV